MDVNEAKQYMHDFKQHDCNQLLHTDICEFFGKFEDHITKIDIDTSSEGTIIYDIDINDMHLTIKQHYYLYTKPTGPRLKDFSEDYNHYDFIKNGHFLFTSSDYDEFIPKVENIVFPRLIMENITDNSESLKEIKIQLNRIEDILRNIVYKLN